ncbi:MAG: hypothetical protein SAJ37_15770 [Oscillatoria sp. PMC 1068.18]|nr:hypothetical protein [Oscillatoria sp. PMC 1076.18]MEC4990191.1 hypothetical protein [Oscillatoria sp. PMC 1068.18]
MAEKQINLSLPDSLYQALNTYQQRQNLDSPSQAAVDILLQFFLLENQTRPYATKDQLKNLENQISRLNRQVTQLNQSYSQLILTQKTQILSLSDSEKPGESESINFPDPNWDDEIEDEPDEILYDFLIPEEKSSDSTKST